MSKLADLNRGPHQGETNPSVWTQFIRRSRIRRRTQGNMSETRTDCIDKSPADLHSALLPLDELFFGPAYRPQCPADSGLCDTDFELVLIEIPLSPKDIDRAFQRDIRLRRRAPEGVMD